ncbi:MAG TPA: glycosyltransferase family 2 protein [Fimbriimonadaceae bacterium]|nr:glycosyltransferase family 2 protein [Fimbriimonadaceae bacterium]
MLSVLIVNWNTKDLLLACLESIFRFPPEVPMEVIVVDNASTDGSAEAVETKNEGGAELIRLFPADENLGYAKGNNAAFALASGEWLLTLNPDTEVFEGTLQRAVDTLKRRQTDGALGARQIASDGSTQRSVRGFPSLLGIAGALTGLDRVLPNSPFGSYTLPTFDYESEGPAPQPMGTFLLFRREALAQIGDPKRPFDEGFPIFFNEVDLLYRLKQAGWGCAYDPQVRILHHGGESTKQVKPKMVWESHRSLIRYLKKHALRWWNWPLLYPLFGVIWLGAWVRARKYDVGFRP